MVLSVDEYHRLKQRDRQVLGLEDCTEADAQAIRAAEPPPEPPRFIILTSGTTGTPKGAQRSSPNGLLTMAALIDKIPYRRGETIVIAAPLWWNT